MLREISQIEKDKYCMLSLVDRIKTVEVIGSDNRMIVVRDWGLCKNKKNLIKGCKLSITRWIMSEDLWITWNNSG